MSHTPRPLRAKFWTPGVVLMAFLMADGAVAITENHILRFYADALFVGLGVLRKRFQAIAGQPLPDPGDPGSPDWWNQGRSAGGDAASDSGMA